MQRTITIAVLTAALLGGCATSTSRTVVPEIADAVSPAAGIISAGRLTRDDMARLKAAGIRHVIDLTPDAETPDFDEQSAVRSAGIRYSNLPVHGPEDLTREKVTAFDELLRRARRPVVVHCGSGNRAGAIAALRAAWIDGKSIEEAVAVGKAWGLKSLESRVRESIQAAR